MGYRKRESISKRLGVSLTRNPHISSTASLVLLTKKLTKQDNTIYDWQEWLRFRDKYFNEILSRDYCIRCAYCQKDLQAFVGVKDPRLATIDHINPVSKNGSMYDKSNMVSCCVSCNQKKGNRI
jgi:5-methylcytosine-specific restriction endonuclease McrA